jgi:PPE-repeat protein
MDFLALPPEINSARIESGPGSAPLLAASSAWAALSRSLVDASTQMAVSLDSLTSAWGGSASVTAISALDTYRTWLMETALHAAQVSGAAMMAATAYETARGASVPLVAVLANRTQLASLVATNILGQNTPAIMATESVYLEMWSQDVAAMVGYLSETQSATAQLQPAMPAPQVATGTGSAAVAQAASLPTGLQSILNFLTSPNNFLTALGNPATPIGFVEAQELALQSSGVYQVASYPLILGLMSQANGMMSRANDLTEQGNNISGEMEQDDRAQAKMTPPPFEQPAPAHVEGSRGGVSKAGALSVPPNWDKATRQVTLASAASPLVPPEGTNRIPGGMMPMPIAAVGGRDGKQRKADELLVRVKFLPTEGV